MLSLKCHISVGVKSSFAARRIVNKAGNSVLNARTIHLGGGRSSAAAGFIARAGEGKQTPEPEELQQQLEEFAEAVVDDILEDIPAEISEAADAAKAGVDAALAPESAIAAPPAEPAGPLESAKIFVLGNPVAYWSLVGAAAFFGGTFVIALFRTFAKGFTSQGKRSRTVNKNKAVVEEFSKYLPSNRAGLTGAVIAGIRLRTGFSPVELFRKYLWYLLRERKFDQEAVDDVIALKQSLGLNDQQVAEALRERAKRVYDKYGNVMLDTTGMSAAGIERKATARALFSKMLFLVESDALLSPEEAATVNLRDIFGATEDDAARLRIASLYEVDLEAAMELPSASEQQQLSGEFDE